MAGAEEAIVSEQAQTAAHAATSVANLEGEGSTGRRG
jgi:hypothetical protein